MQEKIKPAPKPLSEKFISLDEFCRQVGVSAATMWRLRKAGQGPSTLYRVGRRRLAVRATEANAWLESRAAA